MLYNMDYQLYSLAHHHLGYSEYAGPFGLGQTGPGGAQMECPCTGPCTMCTMYRHLKTKEKASKEAPAANPTTAMPYYCGQGPPTSWQGHPWTPWQDISGCLMYCCSGLTCGITGCLATCDVGKRIGTPEAMEFTSFQGQAKACAVDVFPCFCFMCPDYFMGNYW